MAENGRQNNKLKSKQARAITALLSEATIESAAKAAKVGDRTLRRWLADDLNFQAELTQAEAQLIDKGTRQLISLMSTSVETIAAIRDDRDAPYSVRLRAAVTLLDMLVRYRELRNIEIRLGALEEIINAQNS